MSGIIANSGSIQIQGSPTIADFTDVIIGSATVTLTGGGLIALSNNGRNRIYTNSSGGVSLINVDNTIAGAGQIGQGQGQGPFSLVNQASGVIDANQTTALNLYPGLVFTNAGLIEATNTGGLVLDAGFSRVIPRIEGGTSGVIAAFGAGDNVTLNTIVISGGILRTGSGGLIAANTNGTLDGTTSAVTIDTASIVQVSPGGNVSQQGNIVNKGTLQLAGDPTSNAFTDVIIGSPTVTLTGGGLIALSNNGRNRIYSNSSGGVSLINVDNTIAGAGQIGQGQGQGPFSLVNQASGVIDANQTTALNLYPGLVFTNAGLIEATNTGGLVLDAGFSRVIPRIEGGTSGVIAAFGAGDNVTLNTIVISGGILRTGSGGLIQANTNGTLDGTTSAVTIDTASIVQVSPGGNVSLQGAIVNKGMLQLAGNPTIQAFTEIIINSATATLTGGGIVALSNDTRNRIFNDSSSAGTLVNIDNTIIGSGVIGQTQGQGPFALINASAGTIESTGNLALFTAIDGAGTLKVDAGDLLELGGGVAVGQSLVFGGTGASVSLDAPGSFAGTIRNFTTGETLDLRGPVEGLASTFDGTTLTVTNQNGLLGTLTFAGSYRSGQITAANQAGMIVVTASSVVPDVSTSLSPNNNGTLTAEIAALTPAGTSPNIVSVVGGGAAGPSLPGVLNGLAVTSSGRLATTMMAPGFTVGFLLQDMAALLDNNGSALLVSAGANDSLTGAANDTLIGGNGNATLTATSGAETLQGGTGTNAIFLGSSMALVTSNGNDIITGSSGADTVTASGSALYFGTSGTTNFTASGDGDDTIIGGNGGNTVTGGGGSQLIFGSSTLTYIGGIGAATIIGGGGGNTVTGGTGNVLAFASSGMIYTGTGGAATVIGGGGPLNAALGTGGGTAYGSPGGSNLLSTSSTTPSILVGGGNGDVLSASGPGADILVAGGGAETINAAASSGDLVVFGGPGSNVLMGGIGNDLFVAEPGNETLTGGGGTNAYVLINFGTTARSDVVTDFNPNTDAIGLFGYGSAAGEAARLSATVVAGNTVVTLTDGTSLIFVGAPSLHSYNFF